MTIPQYVDDDCGSRPSADPCSGLEWFAQPGQWARGANITYTLSITNAGSGPRPPSCGASPTLCLPVVRPREPHPRLAIWSPAMLSAGRTLVIFPAGSVGHGKRSWFGTLAAGTLDQPRQLVVFNHYRSAERKQFRPPSRRNGPLGPALKVRSRSGTWLLCHGQRDAAKLCSWKAPNNLPGAAHLEPGSTSRRPDQ